MLVIRAEQMEVLAAAYREGFLNRLAAHLTEVAVSLDPDQPGDFQSPPARVRLRERLAYLVAHGFESDAEAAAAMEQWEIFGVDLRSPSAAVIVESKSLWPEEKLDLLWARRAGERAHG